MRLWFDVQFKRPGEAWVTVAQTLGNSMDAKRTMKREQKERKLPASVNWRVKISQSQ